VRSSLGTEALCRAALYASHLSPVGRGRERSERVRGIGIFASVWYPLTPILSPSGRGSKKAPENLQIRAASAITRAPAARLIKGCRGGGEVLKSMIPKSGYRFSEKIMLKCN